MVGEFGLKVGHDLIIHDAESFIGRKSHFAAAVAYFGGPEFVDENALNLAIDSKIPVIPTVDSEGSFETHIPKSLRETNGLKRRTDDPQMSELACALLECIGLLRPQRRAFVSYRRAESRNAAVQLHDLLSGRGFDVFLDTHDIRPSEPFQDILWHRLCDSDVMIMLDTPAYFDSRWTAQEFARARSKGIHIVRVIWPDHTPSRQTDLAETIYLDKTELSGGDGPIIETVANAIVLTAESVRSRSIAFRYLGIVGKLTAELEQIGGKVEGIGAHRAVSLRLPDNQKIWAYPVTGMPTAELLHDVADKAKQANQKEMPVLVYDDIGIYDKWQKHLKWLDENIKTVRAIRLNGVGWTLSGWERGKA
ncbi:MAG: toll/interleukin-1 receptor domain-containing protein [Pseudomonadota bacterium]